MSLIKNMFLKKDEVVECVEKNGMKAAVEKYGLKKLEQFKILFQYEGTELYCDEYISYQRVYNKDGEFLGNITDLMAPFYKKLGYFYGPCMNGNIILSKPDEEKGFKTYAVFNKHAQPLIDYGNYCDKCYIPNGVALLGQNKYSRLKVVTINPEGNVKKQPYTYIEESFVGEEEERKFKITFPSKENEETYIFGDINLE